MQIVRIGQGRSISIYIRLILTVIILSLFALTLEFQKELGDWYFLPGLALASCMPAIWTARRILEIEAVEGSITQYTWTMGRKWNLRKKGPYQFLQLSIDRDEESDTAYLIAKEEKIYLFKGESEEDLKAALVPISKKLQLPIK